MRSPDESAARCASIAGSRALYATDLSIYRQVPIGVVIPRDVDDVIATVAACRERGVPILGRGCGTSLAGQMLQRRRRDRLLEVPEPHPRARPGRHGAPACNPASSTITAQRGEAARADLRARPGDAHATARWAAMIGNNSCGAHTVMGGKTVDNVEELEILTYDGLRMRVGATSDEQLELITAAAAGAREIYASLKASARHATATRSAQRYPKIPRRVSGYNLRRSAARERLPRRPRAGRVSESTCALDARGDASGSVHSPPARVAARARLCRRAAAPPIDVVEIREPRPRSRWRASTRHARHEHEAQGQTASGHLGCCPRAMPGCSSSSAARTRTKRTRKARDALHAALERPAPTPDMKLYRRTGGAELIWEVRENGVGASRVPSEEEPGRAGKTRRFRPTGSATTCATSTSCSDSYGYRYDAVRPFRRGCIHTRITFDLEDRRRHREVPLLSWRTPPTLVVRYGGSLSGEHGDGQAQGRTAAEDVRA